MKKLVVIICVLFLISSLLFSGGQKEDAAEGESKGKAAGKVLIYSPWKDEVMLQFTELFEQETGIKAESINISTGEIYARLKVEKGRPQADIWHSVRAAYLVKAQKEGLIEAHVPENARHVLKAYQYPGDDYIIGSTMYPLVFTYNEDILKELGMEPPENYEDLLDARWKDKIVMPHPAASGTGYTMLSTILQMYRKSGESGIESKEGWEYMSRLSKNIAQFTRSGSAPSKLVASGEFPVGITFYDRVYTLQEAGYPILAVYPSPVYAEPSCTAIVANSPNPEGAKAFLNFMLSKEAQTLARKTGNYSVRPDITPPTGAPELKNLKIFKDDYIWCADYKKDLLKEFNEKIVMAPKE